ncbi:hypothetical protein A2U01_0086275, partial [Trifolium medium]|nr:hypothetical protein [Trifolium medium]
VTETIQENVAIPNDVPNADASVPAENVISDTREQVVIPEKEKSPDQMMTGNASDEHTIVNSQGDESMKIVSANIGDSEPSEKTV